MIIRKKVLWALILGFALIGGGIGAFAIRSAHNGNASATNTLETPPAPVTVPVEKTANQPGAAEPSEAKSTDTVSKGISRRDGHPRSLNYDYSQPHNRTFWQKHRDKLTVAAGAGTGALVGGLIGGGKGAGVGVLAGGAGSALYTYKLRHKRHKY